LTVTGNAVLTNLPQPSAEFCSIVVTGMMNPAIHHPSWYQSIKLLDKAEYEAAITAQMVLMQQASQFVAPEFSVICIPDRWEIQTVRFANMGRLLSVASKVFEVLDHTPVSAYGFNFHFHKDTKVENVGQRLGSVIEKLPLGQKLSGDIAGQFLLAATSGQEKKTKSVAQSQLGKSIAFISLNFHYQVVATQESHHFDLGPLLEKHFWTDEAEAQAFAQSVVEGMPSIGVSDGSRN
jgi:hypothetical protein